ncbi:glycosyltransferase [Polynucleobacter paneuropaeus]|uniref:glycosyltransferase n=1 Tax=Polynucleobacter paneuropaeus TaxID=2527775 RepID=UPI0032E874C9
MRWLGKLHNLNEVLSQYELMIAPMQSKAGIKIKVFEAIQSGLPVLGTINVFSGLPKPDQGFCSNHSNEWCEILENGGTFSYNIRESLQFQNKDR